MKLDLIAYDEVFYEALLDMDGARRVSFGCAVAARYLPLYKAYRRGTDWMAIEPILAAGAKFIEGKKPKLPKRLWDGVADLVSHYYEEGQPLLLYGVCSGTNVLRAIADCDTDYSATCAARCALLSTRVGEEVDATLAAEGVTLETSALVEEAAWRAASIAALAHGPLEIPQVELESAVDLPQWWDALKQCKTPVRQRNLKG